MMGRTWLHWLLVPLAIGSLSMSVLAAGPSTLTATEVQTFAEETLVLQSIATQPLWLAGSGALIGLGVGAIGASVVAFVYKRRSIRERLGS